MLDTNLEYSGNNYNKVLNCMEKHYALNFAGIKK
jgi:hypothetical protein